MQVQGSCYICTGGNCRIGIDTDCFKNVHINTYVHKEKSAHALVHTQEMPALQVHGTGLPEAWAGVPLQPLPQQVQAGRPPVEGSAPGGGWAPQAEGRREDAVSLDPWFSGRQVARPHCGGHAQPPMSSVTWAPQ